MTLILMPKCPVCVAAYALFFTGISLSFWAAAGVRWLMIIVSISALAYLVVGALRRMHLVH
jgi:hypothetical protein